jgi:hypothetical protein
VPRGELGELRVLADELVQAALHVEALRDGGLEQLAPLRGKAAALGGHADDGGGRVEAERVVHARDDRDPVLQLSGPRGVEDRHRRVWRVADHPAGGLAVMRIPRVALSEYEVSLL